jgi:hypothetical protein
MEPNKSQIANQFREAGASRNKDNAHIIISNGTWKLVKEGNQRASFIYPTKEEAILEAKKYGKSGNAKTIIVHKTDGSVDKIYNY